MLQNDFFADFPDNNSGHPGDDTMIQDTPSPAAIPERYSRQVRFAPLGEPGQLRLMNSRVALCGCGALGTVMADALVRAGVGYVRLIDRDFVEISNLQRQVLFDEQDVADQLPKAVAAATKLRRINSLVTVEPIVADLHPQNIESLLQGVDLILDGTDNFETRFLINDAALELNTPWVYGGCVGSHGQTMAIFPGRTACLRCLIESPPEPGTAETCDMAGVLAPAIQVIASLQVTAALKILSGQADKVAPRLTMIDVWEETFRTVQVDDVRQNSNCPTCLHGERKWLWGERGALTTVLCGRNAVQVTPGTSPPLDLASFRQRWAGLGKVTANPFLIRLQTSTQDLEITLFRDGRAIVQGTEDAAVARSAYARYVGT